MNKNQFSLKEANYNYHLKIRLRIKKSFKRINQKPNLKRKKGQNHQNLKNQNLKRRNAK